MKLSAAIAHSTDPNEIIRISIRLKDPFRPVTALASSSTDNKAGHAPACSHIADCTHLSTTV